MANPILDADGLTSTPSDIRLPPYRVEAIVTAKAQVIDWGLQVLGIPELWKETRGKGIRVAVLDTGATPGHPDLVGAIVESADFTERTGRRDVHAIEDSVLKDITDRQGHSTHCCGIVAARDNDTGVVGFAPEADLLVGKVLGDDGSGTSTGVANGIYWAIEQKADIISMSLGSSSPDRAIHDAIKAALAKGIFVIAASGNEGPSLDSVGYPAAWPGVISVGAIDRNRKVANFSSRGDRVDIVAPGDKILSCWPPKNLSVLSGTSMATPAVSGIVALCLAKHRSVGGNTPVITPADMIEHLHKTAIDLDAPGVDPNAGYGLINPEQLLRLYESKPPVQPIPGAGRLELPISFLPDNWIGYLKTMFGSTIQKPTKVVATLE